MPEELAITLSPERLDEGSPEERACFGLLTIRADGVNLTEGFDSWINGYRPGPLVSGYHAAEWLAWNWWRLRWEPQSSSPTWWRAHKMVSIGEGYIWPNLTIFSDGLRTALISRPSSRPNARPFRYVGTDPCILASSRLEAAIDAFVPQVLARLRDSGISETNLDRVWEDLLAERANPGVALRRRLEALLGADPDEATPETIEQLVRDADVLGKNSISELAADIPSGGVVWGADALREVARSRGFDGFQDISGLAPGTLPQAGANSPAWLLGGRVAKTLRAQLGLGATPISNKKLADLASVSERALLADVRDPDLSFVLDDAQSGCRLVLRPKRLPGRRFDLARLLGDRLMNPGSEKLFLATRSRTFRQKAQRSFAAELLAPFEEVSVLLKGDYSEENREDVAAHFQVSERTIHTLLVNHRRIERDDLEDPLEAAAT